MSTPWTEWATRHRGHWDRVVYPSWGMVLDLIATAFCAVAGVYAALQPGTTTVTAAGTSIGISLVPPLCASGYGFGLGNLGVAKGAALLFLANLVAIVLVGTLAFIVTGFSRVVISGIEATELSHEGSAPFARRLARVPGAHPVCTNPRSVIGRRRYSQHRKVSGPSEKKSAR